MNRAKAFCKELSTSDLYKNICIGSVRPSELTGIVLDEVDAVEQTTKDEHNVKVIPGCDTFRIDQVFRTNMGTYMNALHRYADDLLPAWYSFEGGVLS